MKKKEKNTELVKTQEHLRNYMHCNQADKFVYEENQNIFW